MQLPITVNGQPRTLAGTDAEILQQMGELERHGYTMNVVYTRAEPVEPLPMPTWNWDDHLRHVRGGGKLMEGDASAPPKSAPNYAGAQGAVDNVEPLQAPEWNW